MRLIDLTGDRFGRLTVLKRARKNLQGKPAWICECDCGTVKTINGSSLRLGLTRSCGCLRKETTREMVLRVWPSHEGANNPNWRGGTSYEDYDEEFTRSFKMSIRKKDLFCCQVCGMSQEENGEELCVHHIDYDKDNSTPKNCISLCRSCHSKTNSNRRFWYNKLREVTRGQIHRCGS